jgi:hypothetical protein
VVIERARGYPRFASEILDGGGSEAVLAEEAAPGGEQRGAGLGNLHGTQ